MARFNWLDYGVFAAYLAASLGIGIAFTRGQTTIREYFLAGRSMGPVVVAITIMASLFSGISFLGTPSEVYVHGIGYWLIVFSTFVTTPIMVWIFMPFFYRKGYYTAYQYMEARFSVGLRTLSSALFIARVTLWLSVVTYAPALALEHVTGMPLWLSILVTGGLTTLYTTLGGMKAVVWSDVMQFVVLCGGQLVILGVALHGIPGGLGGAMEIARSSGHMNLNFSLDPAVRVTVWAILLGGTCHNLVLLGTDQVAIQRYMTASSLGTAQRSMWIKLVVSLPVFTAFYLTGLVLFAFYQHAGTDPLAAGHIDKADQILPYFAINELPSGLPGLLIAGVFAATMSTISSGINSLTTVSLVDFYRRLWRPQASEGEQMRLARGLTLCYGLLIVALAFAAGRFGSLIEAPVKLFGLIGGPLLGLFLLGMLSRRANAQGAVVGWVAGALATLPVAAFTRTSFLWYPLLGTVTAFTCGWIASLLWPPKPELENLTWRPSLATEPPTDPTTDN